MRDTAQIIGEVPIVLEGFADSDLKDKVRFLEMEVGLDRESLKKVIVAYPQFFERSITGTLRPAYEFWIGRLGLEREALQLMLTIRSEEVWSNPDTLELRWRFATEVMGLNLDEVTSGKIPFFSLSLELFIAPRYFFLRHIGKSVACVDKVFCLSDAKFCKEVAECSIQDYERWKLETWPSSTEAQEVSWIKVAKPTRQRAGGSAFRRSLKREKQEEQNKSFGLWSDRVSNKRGKENITRTKNSKEAPGWMKEFEEKDDESWEKSWAQRPE